MDKAEMMSYFEMTQKEKKKREKLCHVWRCVVGRRNNVCILRPLFSFVVHKTQV